MSKKLKALSLLIFAVALMTLPVLAQGTIPATAPAQDRADLFKVSSSSAGPSSPLAVIAGLSARPRPLAPGAKGISRNPAGAPHIRFLLLLGLVLIETLVIYALLITIIILMVQWGITSPRSSGAGTRSVWHFRRFRSSPRLSSGSTGTSVGRRPSSSLILLCSAASPSSPCSSPRRRGSWATRRWPCAASTSSPTISSPGSTRASSRASGDLSSPGLQLGLFGVIGSLVSASFLFSTLITTINQIFRTKYHRSFFYNRLIEFLMMAVVGIFMLFSLAMTAVWTAIGRTLQESELVRTSLNPEAFAVINNVF